MLFSHRIPRLHFALALLLTAAAVSVIGARDAQAEPLNCTQIKDHVTASNEPVRASFSEYFAGKKHKLVINHLLIQGVSSVSAGEDCSITMVMDAKIDRKFRPDARGTVTVRVQAVAIRTSSTGLDFTLSQPHVTSVSLSRTLGVTEKAYKEIANLLVKHTATIHVEL